MFFSKVIKFLSFLSISVSFLSFSPVLTQAQSSAPQNPDLPQLPISNPKIKLITLTCNDKSCNSGDSLDWSKATISNKKNYTDYSCIKNGKFAGQIVKGIDDYSDGISLNNFKTYPNASIATIPVTPYDKIKSEYDKLRMACQYENQMAGNNFKYGCSTDAVLSVPKYDEVRPEICTDPGIGNSSKSANNTVYAYQFRYNLKFSESEKVDKSNLYRSVTGLDGVYDGVSMTYTYYSYNKDGKFKNWENPNKSNANGGWLIYGNSTSDISVPASPKSPSSQK
jgi:hypothetical protein